MVVRYSSFVVYVLTIWRFGLLGLAFIGVTLEKSQWRSNGNSSTRWQATSLSNLLPLWLSDRPIWFFS
jgi:hypothetical protein